MQYIADLHIHSPFSRATSKASNLAGLFAWARIKGINLIGTGDFTHPGWFSQLKEQLTEAEPGFFRLRDEKVAPALDNVTPEGIPVRFMLSAEISSIYKKDGAVRKIHNIIYVPDLESAERISGRLAAIGNIESDGRPILGLDARNLLEIVLEEAPDGFLVPAHVWTPWFSLFGSKSGFDKIEDCFEDLTEHIFALETGLSSDPEMNRLISALDRFTLISNSDCHSPSKLGREANLFDGGFDYFSLRDALKNPSKGNFKGTIEFFPEEGKYHYDGHRKCQVCLDPLETRKLNNACPVCSRGLTIGVTHRVMELADRETPLFPEHGPEFHSFIPLAEVLGEIIGCGPNTKGVTSQYGRIINRFGSEFNLFFKADEEEINRVSPFLGEAVQRIRDTRVIRSPGYDGEFGVITVFEEGELDRLAGQKGLFADAPTVKRRKKTKKTARLTLPANKPGAHLETSHAWGPNPAQEAAISSKASHILVTAGPGTGKTYTLVNRLKKLLNNNETRPGRVAAITFTNRAADEIRERLLKQDIVGAEAIFVGTFHGFCLEWLRREPLAAGIIGAEQRLLLFKKLFPDKKGQERNELSAAISEYFQAQATENPAAAPNEQQAKIKTYIQEIKLHNYLDIEEIIPCFVKRLKDEPDLLEAIQEHLDHLLIDEFQDLNQAQYELVKLLGQQAKVFAIGDPNQAIYGFSGSDLRYFLDYAGQPDTTTMALTCNYRSASEIIEAGTAVIGHNRERSRDRLEPFATTTGLLERHTAPTEKAEAEFIVQRIEEIMGGISHFSINSGRGGATESDQAFCDIAVLYRLSRQAEAIGEALERRGIPFQQIGATPFFMRPALRPAYYLCQITAGIGSSADFLALLGSTRGMGQATISRLEQEFPLNCADFFEFKEKTAAEHNTRQAVLRLRKNLESFRQAIVKKGIAQALQEDMSFLNLDHKHHELPRLIELAGIFGRDLERFAFHLRQNKAATIYDPQAESVALMTLHAAKGLEFPVVFLAGLEEGLLPCTMGTRACDIEEERRLFYMGLTRARERLILSSAASRSLFGKTEEQTLSRFIAEIPAQLFTATSLPPKKKTKKKTNAQQLKLF